MAVKIVLDRGSIFIKETYPIIKSYSLNDGLIVFFTKPKTGMVLKSFDVRQKVGDFITDWDEGAFKPCIGKIIMSNEEG